MWSKGVNRNKIIMSAEVLCDTQLLYFIKQRKGRVKCLSQGQMDCNAKLLAAAGNSPFSFKQHTWCIRIFTNPWQSIFPSGIERLEVMQPLFMNITGFKDFSGTKYRNARLSCVCKPHRSFINIQYNIYLNRSILGMLFEVKVTIIGQLKN